MKSKCQKEFPPNLDSSLCTPGTIRSNGYAKRIAIFGLLLAISCFIYISNVAAHNLHRIEMYAKKPHPDYEYLAYGMIRHEITDKNGLTTDITSRYSTAPIIPGPTIIMDEGDVAEITLYSEVPIPENADHVDLHENVSLHVHGVHYDIVSDGTLKYINLFKDEGATLVQSYTYRWDAAFGTAGTWAYHDHNMHTHNGAEDKGLYGALIVNPASRTVSIGQDGGITSVPLSSIAKDYILYVIDDAFVGTEIDNRTGQQTPIWVNPALSAQAGTNIRFHLIAMGTNFHQFKLPGYSWPDPATRTIIEEKAIGPLEKHVFAIKAGASSSYMDASFAGKAQNMTGSFTVNP
ncbi:multicopper oxidase domain-containing protein [Nitrosomonas sp. Is35]|uniref:multicopper oxidase domain-containing protein n=1 Tax=Nitrosomonas sp. Is35 TaxID=3080534 RepID=UPI00294AA9CF|nr:multicopper oxidase domain-containing protein [Nitrosomonas sp. Is35]MDV6348357.1 multicopper oxidase domain-containing protein [Nitrosomonas sp. Is35]